MARPVRPQGRLPRVSRITHCSRHDSTAPDSARRSAPKMKFVCIGGGPAGLYFALLMKQRGPHHDITVVERNRPYDTFGWGVVFSDATMDNMRQWDRETAESIESSFAHWDDIELLFKGRAIRSGGHGFVGIGRKKLLNILQARCEDLGVKLVFETEVVSDLDFPDADLIIASDGINSGVRQKYADIFKPISSRGPIASSGWARKSATTPSHSFSSAPNTAGFRPISTSSTMRPAPSSSSARKRSGRTTGSTVPVRKSRLHSVKNCSLQTCAARG